MFKRCLIYILASICIQCGGGSGTSTDNQNNLDPDINISEKIPLSLQISQDTLPVEIVPIFELAQLESELTLNNEVVKGNWTDRHFYYDLELLEGEYSGEIKIYYLDELEKQTWLHESLLMSTAHAQNKKEAVSKYQINFVVKKTADQKRQIIPLTKSKTPNNQSGIIEIVNNDNLIKDAKSKTQSACEELRIKIANGEIIRLNPARVKEICDFKIPTQNLPVANNLDPNGDEDNDRVINQDDSHPLDPTRCQDSDNDGCDDCSVVLSSNTSRDGVDTDGDGLCDLGDNDIDNDGVLNGIDQEANNALVCQDSDNDGCDDCSLGNGAQPNNDGVDTDGDGICDLGDNDIDNDGVLNGVDREANNSLICQDSDNDGCDDCSLGNGAQPNNDGADLDGDGLCDLGDNDADGDGVLSRTDSDDRNRFRCVDQDADGCDECNSGRYVSPQEDGEDFDGDWLCDLGDPDDDNDGVNDEDDQNDFDRTVCQDVDRDGCDECSSGRLTDVNNDGVDTDGDGLCDLGDLDDDNDGVNDREDRDPRNNRICRDADRDGCDDCSLGNGAQPNNDGADLDGDGLCDLGDNDIDNDGVINAEDQNVNDPRICHDRDQDGCDECSSGRLRDVNNDGVDSDQDGICDLTDDVDDNEVLEENPDRDGDGIDNDQDPAPDNNQICGDQDGDQCDDCSWEGRIDLANDGFDFDQDGLCDDGDLDDDDDGINDDEDIMPLNRGICGDRDGDSCDDCSIAENQDVDGDGLCDDGDLDDDNDGVMDVDDPMDNDARICGDNNNDGNDDCFNGGKLRFAPCGSDIDNDGCDDCLLTGEINTAMDGYDYDRDGICNIGDPDPDNDGIVDDNDPYPYDATRCGDRNNDFIDDCAEVNPNCGIDRDQDGCDDCSREEYEDMDNDGICNLYDNDIDGDGVLNEIENQDPILERFYLNPLVCGDSDNDGCDDCGLVGIMDPSNDGIDKDQDGLCDLGDEDDDNDGVNDDLDPDDDNIFICGDTDNDNCDDCSLGAGFNPSNDGIDSNDDGICDSLIRVFDGELDQDNDGVLGINDPDDFNAGICGDRDEDGCDDCSLSETLDFDDDGICDLGDRDDDNDGVSDLNDTHVLNANWCKGVYTNRRGNFSPHLFIDKRRNIHHNLGGVSHPGYGIEDICQPFAKTHLLAGSALGNYYQMSDIDNDGVSNRHFSRFYYSNIDRMIEYYLEYSRVNLGDNAFGTKLTYYYDEAIYTITPIYDAVLEHRIGREETPEFWITNPDNGSPLARIHEVNYLNNPLLCGDFDRDGCNDCSGGFGYDPFNDGPDYDGDGYCDQDPNLNHLSLSEQDQNGDGLLDQVIVREQNLGYYPETFDVDYDGDGVINCRSAIAIQVLDDDHRGFDIGILSGRNGRSVVYTPYWFCDVDDTNHLICGDDDLDGCDDCSRGMGADANNDGNDYDDDGLCDLGDVDDDNDQRFDLEDDEVFDSYRCGDSDGDGCDDCYYTGQYLPLIDGVDSDFDGLCDLGDPDDDNDGFEDFVDPQPFDQNECGDSDSDGCDDCSYRELEDDDQDGICNYGEELDALLIEARIIVERDIEERNNEVEIIDEQPDQIPENNPDDDIEEPLNNNDIVLDALEQNPLAGNANRTIIVSNDEARLFNQSVAMLETEWTYQLSFACSDIDSIQGLENEDGDYEFSVNLAPGLYHLVLTHIPEEFHLFSEDYTIYTRRLSLLINDDQETYRLEELINQVEGFNINRANVYREDESVVFEILEHQRLLPIYINNVCRFEIDGVINNQGELFARNQYGNLLVDTCLDDGGFISEVTTQFPEVIYHCEDLAENGGNNDNLIPDIGELPDLPDGCTQPYCLEFMNRLAVSDDVKEIQLSDVNNDGYLDIISLSERISVFENLLPKFLVQESIHPLAGVVGYDFAANAEACGYAQTITRRDPFTGENQEVDIGNRYKRYGFVSIILSQPLENQDPNYILSNTYPVGNFPTDLEVKDVNGDGHPDIIVTNHLRKIKPGEGFVTDFRKLQVSPNQPENVPGLELSCFPEYGAINILLGTGNNEQLFINRVEEEIPGCPRNVTVEDINLDGQVDLLVSSNCVGSSGNDDTSINSYNSVDYHYLFDHVNAYLNNNRWGLRNGSVQSGFDGTRPQTIYRPLDILNNLESYDLEYGLANQIGNPGKVEVKNIIGNEDKEIIVMNYVTDDLGRSDNWRSDAREYHGVDGVISGRPSVSILAKNHGIYRLVKSYLLGIGADDFEVVDVNNDNRLDIISNTFNGLMILGQKADGNFYDYQDRNILLDPLAYRNYFLNYQIGFMTKEIITADFDQDGFVDVALPTIKPHALRAGNDFRDWSYRAEYNQHNYRQPIQILLNSAIPYSFDDEVAKFLRGVDNEEFNHLFSRNLVDCYRLRFTTEECLSFTKVVDYRIPDEISLGLQFKALTADMNNDGVLDIVNLVTKSQYDGLLRSLDEILILKGKLNSQLQNFRIENFDDKINLIENQGNYFNALKDQNQLDQTRENFTIDEWPFVEIMEENDLWGQYASSCDPILEGNEQVDPGIGLENGFFDPNRHNFNGEYACCNPCCDPEVAQPANGELVCCAEEQVREGARELICEGQINDGNGNDDDGGFQDPNDNPDEGNDSNQEGEINQEEVRRIANQMIEEINNAPRREFASHAEYLQNRYEDTTGIGVLLNEENPDELAINVLTDKMPVIVEISEDGSIRRKIDLLLKSGVTVREVNNFLRRINSTISSMARGSYLITLIIPELDDENLELLLARLNSEQSPFYMAIRAYSPKASVGPGGGLTRVDDQGASFANNLDQLKHNFVSGMFGAWNLKNAINSRDCSSVKTIVFVTDFFTANTDFDFRRKFGAFDYVPSLLANGQSLYASQNENSYNHGNNVLAFLSNQLNGGYGINPKTECTYVVAIEAYGYSNGEFYSITAKEISMKKIAYPNAKIVVNFSLGYIENISTWSRYSSGLSIRLLFGFTYNLINNPDILIVYAAGNSGDNIIPAYRWSYFDTPFAQFKLDLDQYLRLYTENVPQFLPADGSYVPVISRMVQTEIDHIIGTMYVQRLLGIDGNSNNTLAIGNARVDFTGSLLPENDQGFGLDQPTLEDISNGIFNYDIEPALSSSYDADIYAIGTNVPGFSGNLLRGSSYASPQVAGLASYLWSMEADLIRQGKNSKVFSSSDLRNLIINSGNPFPVTIREDRFNGERFIIMNGLNTLLALDRTDLEFNSINTPVRYTMVDINEDGRFDQLDILRMIDDVRTDLNLGNPMTCRRSDLDGDCLTKIVDSFLSYPIDLDGDGIYQSASGWQSFGYYEYPESTDRRGSPNAIGTQSDSSIFCYHVFKSDTILPNEFNLGFEDLTDPLENLSLYEGNLNPLFELRDRLPGTEEFGREVCGPEDIHCIYTGFFRHELCPHGDIREQNGQM